MQAEGSLIRLRAVQEYFTRFCSEPVQCFAMPTTRSAAKACKRPVECDETIGPSGPNRKRAERATPCESSNTTFLDVCSRGQGELAAHIMKHIKIWDIYEVEDAADKDPYASVGYKNEDQHAMYSSCNALRKCPAINQRIRHMFLDLTGINSSSTYENPLLRWPRYASSARSVKLKLPEGKKRPSIAIIEQHLRQTLEDGKAQLCNVDMLEMEGQGPTDTQLIQQLWQTMPSISRLKLSGLQSPSLLQHATVLHQLSSLVMANMHFADHAAVQEDEDKAEQDDDNTFLMFAVLFGGFGAVQQLRHANHQPIESRLDLLSPLTNLRQLRLCASGGSRDGSMSHLSTLVHLTHLDCWYYPLEMVARDLSHLTTLTAMQHLAFLGSVRTDTELYLDPLQHMAHLTCLELYSRSEGLSVGGWHAVGKPGNAIKKLFLRELEVIVPKEPAPRVYWPCLQKLDTRYSPDPLLLSVLQLHLQNYEGMAPPAIEFSYLNLTYDHDASVFRDAVGALHALGVTSFAFVLKDLHQLEVLEPLGQQLVQVKIELMDTAAEQDLTQQNAMDLVAALPKLQHLEVHGIGSSGGAEALLDALTELKTLTVESSKAHVEAWKKAVRKKKRSGLVFKAR